MSTSSSASSSSGSASGSSSGNSTSATFTSIPQTAAAGGVSFTQPATSSSAFYKIASNEPNTFGWNFTGLYVTPTHLTVSAVCSQNGQTYPVGPTDGVIAGSATEVTWDLWSYQNAHSNVPLVVGTYMLHIWDDRGPGAQREPGLFQENSALEFALYTPQPYTPLESTYLHCSTTVPCCRPERFVLIYAHFKAGYVRAATAHGPTSPHTPHSSA